jgi:hypothetical protein
MNSKKPVKVVIRMPHVRLGIIRCQGLSLIILRNERISQNKTQWKNDIKNNGVAFIYKG